MNINQISDIQIFSLLATSESSPEPEDKEWVADKLDAWGVTIEEIRAEYQKRSGHTSTMESL